MFKMKFFGRKKDSIYPSEGISEKYKIRLSERNFDELAVCDTALKFWLPESIEKMIDEMCTFQDTSASDIIRQILFIHLYGRYDLFGLIERQIFTYKLNRVESRLDYCDLAIGATEKTTVPSHKFVTPEKSIADVKVWVPNKMKDEIKSLAERHGKKPSAYVREVIATHLMGNVFMLESSQPPNDEEETNF